MTTIKAFDCELCGMGPSVGVTTFRVNAKGQPGIFRCAVHLDKDVDPDVKAITDMLERLP